MPVIGPNMSADLFLRRTEGWNSVVRVVIVGVVFVESDRCYGPTQNMKVTGATGHFHASAHWEP